MRNGFRTGDTRGHSRPRPNPVGAGGAPWRGGRRQGWSRSGNDRAPHPAASRQSAAGGRADPRRRVADPRRRAGGHHPGGVRAARSLDPDALPAGLRRMGVTGRVAANPERLQQQAAMGYATNQHIQRKYRRWTLASSGGFPPRRVSTTRSLDLFAESQGWRMGRPAGKGAQHPNDWDDAASAHDPLNHRHGTGIRIDGR